MIIQNSNNWLNYGLTILAYILIIAPTVYIIYLCIQQGISILFWHVVSFTLAYGLLMIEGNLSISGDAFLVSKISRNNRIRIHWILHLLGLLMTAMGIVAGIMYIKLSGLPHFISLHGILGLLGVILTVLAASNGVMTSNPKSFFGCISLGQIKILHAIMGFVATILMFAGQITGLRTEWWQGENLGWTLSALSIAYLVGLVLVFIKPTLTTVSRVRTLFQ